MHRGILSCLQFEKETEIDDDKDDDDDVEEVEDEVGCY